MDLLLYYEDKVKGDGKLIDSIMVYCTSLGDTEMMKLLHEWGSNIMNINGAVMSGNIAALKLLFSWGAKLNQKPRPREDFVDIDQGPTSFGFHSSWFMPSDSEYIISSAIKTNSVAMLKFLLDNGCVPTSENVRKAVSYGLMHIIKLLKEKKCPITESTIINGISWENPRIDLLKELLSWYGTVNENFYCAAVMGGSVQALKFMKETYGIPDSTKIMKAALEIRSKAGIEIIKLLHEWGVPWEKTPETFRIAVYTHNTDIMKFFHEQGCPYAQDGSSAEGLRSVEHLELLHSWGVPFNEHLMSTAIYEENIELMRLLHEYGVGFETDGRSFAPVFWRSEEIRETSYRKVGAVEEKRESMLPSHMARLLHDWGCPIGDPNEVLVDVAKAGNVTMMKLLLDEWHVDCTNEETRKNIFLLGTTTHEMIQFLYDRGFRWPDTGEALLCCMRNGFSSLKHENDGKEILDKLLDWGHPTKFDNPEFVQTLLDQFIRYYPGSQRLGEVLLKQGAKPDENFYAHNANKRSLEGLLFMKKFGIEDTGICVREAARCGDAQLIEKLLEGGFTWDQDGITLENAIKSRNLGVVKLLVERGCPINSAAKILATNSGNKAIEQFFSQII